MGSLSEKGSETPKDGPGPRQVLQILREAIFNDSRLKTTEPEGIASQLLANGTLPKETSLTLVYEMLEVLGDGGVGLRSPELQPCSLELFWDHKLGRTSPNVDLSMAVDWIGAPYLPVEGSLPVRFTRTQSPRCTDLISDPVGTLQNKERWPTHLCASEFMRQSTELWAQALASLADDSLNIYRWASMWPLPIGRRALMIRPEVDDLSEWREVFDVLPFDEYQTALWALRIEREQSLCTHTLDFFGLVAYPTEWHKRFEMPATGELAYSVRGQGDFFTSLLSFAAKWWGQFCGLSLRGRLNGSGTWESREHFIREMKRLVREIRFEGEKPTQDRVGERLHVDARQIRAWCKDQFGVEWQELKKG